MDPLTASVLIGAGSSAVNSAVSYFSAERQMDFQAKMSGTAYRRSMSDMRAAGLNPILAYSKGGASTPGGAGFTASDLAGSVSSAMQARRAKAEIQNIKANTRKTDVEGTLLKVREPGARVKENMLEDLWREIQEGYGSAKSYFRGLNQRAKKFKKPGTKDMHWIDVWPPSNKK